MTTSPQFAALNTTSPGASKSARLLQQIRRDMDIKAALMRKRRRNEEILALDYEGSGSPGGGGESENLRENALNLPYRWLRWMESQATSKQLVVKVNRDAGAGQKPGGPGDEETGRVVSTALRKVGYKAGFTREIKAVMGEVAARGTSVMAIGYHKELISLTEAKEAGKDAQSVAPEVMGAEHARLNGKVVDESAYEAKPGQDNPGISAGLANMAGDENVQLVAGQDAVAALLERKASHDQAEFEAETDDKPVVSTRLRRHRIYMEKRRVGEDVGWTPHVYDVEDAGMWWERRTFTVAEVKASDLFTDSFKAQVNGYDGHNISGVASGAQTPSTDSMGSDARQAQSENVLDEEERIVEVFLAWMRRPNMKSGGVRKIVCAEVPDEFIEADESNPHVDDDGYPLIEGFYPYFDFTPILPILTTPERTCGVPPVAVGMPQFEQIAEANRLIHEAALRSVRLWQIHPGLKDVKVVMDAVKNGTPLAFVAPQSMVGLDGKIEQAVIPIQFTGEMPEIERYAALMRSQWIEVMGMPPAVLQGQGTADTLGQDQQGIAAGERESGALVGYFESRMADVFTGIRGLMRGCYDDEDFIPMLGEADAALIKKWQEGSNDEYDEIEVTFGARAIAQETVDRKQMMEYLALLRSSIDPITGQPVYDEYPVLEEIARSLEMGAPKASASNLKQLQTTIIALAQVIKQLTGVDPLAPQQPGGGGGAAPQQGGGANGSASKPGKPGGPAPAEGGGPETGTLDAGAKRGTVSMVSQGTTTQTY